MQYPYNKLKQIYEIFQEKEESSTINKAGEECRSYKFILPDTIFPTYNYGIRTCSISESLWEGFSVQVYYGTIDDSAMSFCVFIKNIIEMHKTYDKLIEILHLDLIHKSTPIGLSYVVGLDYKGFEEGVKELLIQHLRSICDYYIVFDYN